MPNWRPRHFILLWNIHCRSSKARAPAKTWRCLKFRATRIERQPGRALQVMRELVEAEFARLTLRGVFAFGT